MASDRWRLISQIYHEALGQPAEARDAFVHHACEGDAQLEHDVRSLIAQPSSESFFDAVLQQESAGVLGQAGQRLRARLGRFEVRGLLGAGGMGEVYRAFDATLGREVAIKVLPPTFTRDAERLVRFEREARILAALSHPHIASIYGLEEIADAIDQGATARALVLELVDGDTLAERLDRSQLSIGEAIEIARQIADGVEAAHDKGVVHRDLKPANIKIRSDGVVKILDFGLAKAEGLSGGSASGRRSDSAETARGVILGTPAYMSPEQARGGVVDKRADVWAFGCVLFEMLAGRAPFGGDTPADTLAAVLDREPDWTLLPPATPDGVHRLLRRCLEKNPKRRLRDIGDARLELEDEPRLAKPTPRRRFGVLAAAAVAAVFTLAALLIPRLRPAGALETVQFTLEAPEGHAIIGVPVPSPDGRHLVFVAHSPSRESALWVRAVGATAAQRIAGTENASNPFWSPDGRFVGFSVDRVLKRTAIAGGPVQRITELDPVTLGATWNRDDVIVLAPTNQAPLHRVGAAGGAPEPLTTLNSERRENSHRWPQFLPDGRHFIFTARSDLPQHTAVYVASLDNPGAPIRLVAAQTAAAFVSPGLLLFVRDNTLLAQRFDIRTLALTGNATAIAGNVARFAASADGTVLTHIPVAMTHLAWFDRSGSERESIPARGRFTQVRLSPDESRAAVVTFDTAEVERDIWVVALSDGGITRVTSNPSADWFPAWSPDGSEIIFASERNDGSAFYVAPSTGGGSERRVFQARNADFVAPTDWSRDGRFVLFHSYPRADISVLPLATPEAPMPLIASPFTDWVASFSPDGRWVAYVSDETGQHEVYVGAVDQSRRYRVSVGGGIQPRWRRDGRELFFIGEAERLFAAPVTTEASFHFEPPKPLFQACPGLPGQERSPFMYRYDVGRDGARSLWMCAEKETRSPTVAVHALAAFSRR
jgi:Tol biopolymer transport system component